MFIVKLKCYLVPRLVLRTCGVEKVVWGPKPAPNMHSFWKAPPGDPVRAFVLAPLAFAHSAADRFWLADARQNRRNWRPLGARKPSRLILIRARPGLRPWART